jgi:hypothetical protein
LPSVSLREHVAELAAARGAGGSSAFEQVGRTNPEPVEGPPATLPNAINAVLALIDDPARWPAKATRIQNQLRKALIAAHDALKADAVPLHLSRPAPSFVSRSLKDAPAALPRAFTNAGNRSLGLARLGSSGGAGSAGPATGAWGLHDGWVRRVSLRHRETGPASTAQGRGKAAPTPCLGDGGAGSGPGRPVSSGLPGGDEGQNAGRKFVALWHALTGRCPPDPEG